MNVAEYVFAGLANGGDGLRAHHEKLPRDNDSLRVTLPALVITTVTGRSEMDLRGDSGLRRYLIQLDAWATSRKGADDYMELARARMLAATTFSVGAIDITGAGGYDAEANLYRASFEFGLWVNL